MYICYVDAVMQDCKWNCGGSQHFPHGYVLRPNGHPDYGNIHVLMTRCVLLRCRYRYLANNGLWSGNSEMLVYLWILSHLLNSTKGSHELHRAGMEGGEGVQSLKSYHSLLPPRLRKYMRLYSKMQCYRFEMIVYPSHVATSNLCHRYFTD